MKKKIEKPMEKSEKTEIKEEIIHMINGIDDVGALEYYKTYISLTLQLWGKKND